MKIYLILKQIEYNILLKVYSRSSNKLEASEFIQRKSKELQIIKAMINKSK